MPINQELTIYSFGFEHNSKLYCWKNKNLYRMPCIVGNRNYSIRMLMLQKNGGSYGYWIGKDFKSMTNLEEITKNINHKETVYIDNGIPF